MPASTSSSEDGLWTRRLTLGDINLVVQEEWGSSIGGTMWEGGALLAHFLASRAFTPRLAALPPAARAIELGAGVTALPALVTAILASRTGALVEVIASDVDECLEGLAASVRGNAPPGATVVVEGGGGGGGGGGCDGDHAATRSSTSRDGWDLPASVVQAVAGETDADGCLVDPHPPGPPPAAAVAAHKASDGEPCGRRAVAAAAAGAADAAAAHTGDHHPVTVRVMDVDWARVPAMVGMPSDAGGLGPAFDLVLVADAVYYAPAMPALVAAMRCATAPGGTALLAFYERSRPAAATFWPRLRCAFDVTPIPAASFGCEGADAPSRADGTGPPVGIFELSRVSDDEFQRREAARVAAEEGGEGDGSVEEEEEEGGDEGSFD